MPDQPLTAREFEEILRRMNSGGGAGGLRSGGARGGSNDADRLNNMLDETASSMQNYLSVQKEYTKRHQAGSFAAGLFNKSTEMSTRNMGQLRSAIAQHERALDELTSQGHTATSTQYKKVQADLKVLQGQEQMYNAQATGAEVIRNASGQVFQTFLRLGTIQAEYQANLLNIVAQGGSGFQMAAAAMENAVNQMHAMQTTMASIAQSAGQSLGQLGGKFAPLAGMGLTALGHAAQAAADAARTLAQAQIRIMAQEGDKLIKTHYQLTQTGVIFGNGMTGLIDATHGTKLRLEEMSQVVNQNRETFASLGIGMSSATKLIGGVAKMLAATTGKFAYADRQLLALGYSYSEQAELAAESAQRLARGGQQVNERQVAEATMEMAKNMRLVAEVAGEDMKEKRKTIQEEQKKFAINAALAKMARDEPQKYKQYMAQLDGMTATQRKASYEILAFGTVRDKDLAIQMALNKGFRKTVQENDAALKNGTAGTKQALDTQKRNAKETADGYIAMGQTVGKANMALGSFEGVSQGASESLTEAGKMINANVNQAEKNIEALKNKAKKPDPKDPTSLLLTAVEKGAMAAKKLQDEVIKKLPRLASALEQAYKDAMATLRGEGGGGVKDPTGILGWLQKHLPEVTAAITALTLAVQMFGHKIPGVFQNLKEKIFKPKGLPGTGGIVSEAPTAPEAPSGESRAERRRRERAERRSPGGTRGRLPSTAPLPSTTTPGGLPSGGGGGRSGGMLGELADGLKKFGPALKSIGLGIGGAVEGFLRGVAGGISAFANPMVIAGSVGFGVAIAAIGAGIAGAAWITGKALPTLAKGLVSFNDVDGKALVDVGLGVAALGAGLLVFGAGSAVGGAGNVIGNIADGLTNLFGGKDLISRLKEFSTLGPGLKTSGDGLVHVTGGLGKFGGTLATFIKTDLKPLDPIIEKLKALREAAKPPEVSVVDAAKNVIASTLNAAANYVNPPTTAKPSSPPAAEFSTADRKNIQTWVDGVNAGRFTLDQVPAPYRAEVAKLAKKQPAQPSTARSNTTQSRTTPGTNTSPTAARPTTGTPVDKPGNTPPPRVTLGSLPGKTALTAAEKANAMETVAGNTKYTNDLLIASQKNIESLQKVMIQRLESIVSATEATAGYGKKTMRNTS